MSTGGRFGAVGEIPECHSGPTIHPGVGADLRVRPEKNRCT